MVESFDIFFKVLQAREWRKLELKQSDTLPDFDPSTAHIRQSSWTVSPVPRRLQCRHVDLGDVSPSNTSHFVAAMKSSAQGIQVRKYTVTIINIGKNHRRYATKCKWTSQLNIIIQVPVNISLSNTQVVMLVLKVWNRYQNTVEGWL